jgi:hypothetical protein
MKAILLYVFLMAVAVNVATNMAGNTAQGLQKIQLDRHAALCEVNEQYCL